jgi:tRNA A-37 threonylcarbamoyl transferase component Bud32
MAVCKNCGSDVAEKETLCPSCGLPVSDVAIDPSVDSLSDQSTLSMPFPDLEDTPPAESKSKDDFERTMEVLEDTEEAVFPSTAGKLPTPDLAITPLMIDTVGEAPFPATEEPPTQEKVITNGISTDESAGAQPSDGEVKDTGPGTGKGREDGKTSGLRQLAEGVVLNSRYEILRKIGGGGMGAVYLATDRNLGGVERAVKEMVQSSIEEEQQKKAIEDFKRESVILTTLDHPSIPTIYDYFFDEEAGRFYLVMKYISGGDLATRLRGAPGGRIDEKTVTGWAIQIADVLSYLHTLPATVVYRDLKPSNIMIDGRTGRVMIIDFGIARSINQP